MVTVTEADADHAEDICRVCSAGWHDAYADVLADDYVEANVETFYDPGRIEAEIRESDATERWLVALSEEIVVGAIRDHRPEPGVGEVSVLYVHPERQGEGVGSALMAALTERQRERGATEQWVYVFADHDDGLGFYRSAGFEVAEEYAAATVDGVDPECETLRLSRPI